MNIEAIREYCLSFPFSSEDMPFGDDIVVFRVHQKIFALMNINQIPHFINLKCNPEKALILREKYHNITGAYHMNKKHWNTIVIENFSASLLKDLINHSYNEVLKKIPKKIKNQQ